MGAITIDNVTETLLFNTLSAQQTELLVAIEVFRTHHEPFNLFSDSKYVVNAIQLTIQMDNLSQAQSFYKQTGGDVGWQGAKGCAWYAWRKTGSFYNWLHVCLSS